MFNALFNFLGKYDIFVVITGILLTIIGMSLTIKANEININAFLIEQGLQNTNTNTNNESDITNILKIRTQASAYNYAGVIIVCVGFIISNILQGVIIQRQKLI